MNSYFNFALIISVILHITIIGIAAFGPFSMKQKQKPKKAETDLVKIEEKQTQETKIKKRDKLIKTPPPYLDLKDQLLNLKENNRPNFKNTEIKKVTRAKKKVVFNKPKESLDSMPAYVNYYEKIRNKIRNFAYSSYKKDISGKILLTFTVLHTGNIKNININQNKSTNSNYLHNIALQSIKKASPFPEFPDKLSEFKKLNFNLSIHFKRN